MTRQVLARSHEKGGYVGDIHGLARISIRRNGELEARDDLVVIEEPMEIRVDSTPIAVLMRTPGQDRALGAGFLLTEGVIEVSDDLTSIGPCEDPNRPNAHNIILAHLAPGSPRADERIKEAQRHFYASSSCGLCGKASIESIHQRVKPHAHFTELSQRTLTRRDALSREHQPCFKQSGACHSAIAFTHQEEPRVLASAEDVGRHNAVDKVIGQLLLKEQLPLDEALLWVSGRASFEVVQKALMGGFHALICVGAPTSLAVELARESHLTLIGFATGAGRYNLYAGALKGE